MSGGVMKAGAVAAMLLAANAAEAAFPYNGMSPIPSDPAAMALAKKAVGTCRWNKAGAGPQVEGFTTPKGIGWTVQGDGGVYVRVRGAQRIAVMTAIGDRSCRILAVQPLPPKTKSEAFKQCRVESPDPNVTALISEGLGLIQHGKPGLAAYLEADFKARTLTPRAGDDRRIICSEFENGE